MNRLIVPVMLLALALGGCKSGTGRSLVQVDIEPAMNVPGVVTAHLFVKQGGNEIASKLIAWDKPAGERLKIGFYLPAFVEGAVAVEAYALDVGGRFLGRTETLMTVIKPGQVTELLTLHLVPWSGDDPDGGLPDAGPATDAAVTPEAGSGGMDIAPGGDTAPGIDAAPGADTMPAPDAGPEVPVGLTWKPTENLEKDMVTRSYIPAVGVDAKGNTLVVWSERTAIKTKRYDAATKAWGAIKSIDTKNADDLSMAMAANGHATVVWNASIFTLDPADAGLWATHTKDGGETWSPPKHVHQGPVYVYNYTPLALAIARNGDARVAWEESMNNMRTLWSARYDDVTGTWSDIAPVKQGEDTDERYEKIAMDAAGNGLLVWQQRDAMMMESTWATSFLAGQPLKAPQILDTNVLEDTDDPAVAIMANGQRGIVVWGQATASGSDLTYSDWTPAGGFGPPTKIVSSPNWTGAHAAVIDHNGTVTLAWTQPISSGKANAVVARREANQPWGAVELLEATNQSPQQFDQYPYPQVGVDSVGTVHVAWVRKINAMDETTYGAFTRRWQNGMWQPEVTIGLKTKLRSSDPQLAVGEAGHAAIVLDYYGSADPEAAYNIFAALYQ